MAVGERREARVALDRQKGLMGWMLVVALGAVGCGGQSTTKDGAAMAAAGAGGAADPGPDGAIPTRGFYRKSIMTVADSCTWPGTAAGDIGLVGASATDVAAELGPTNLLQQVPWRGLKVTLPSCNTVITAHVLSRDESSFVLDVAETWPAPDKCGLTPKQVPASACSGEWIETFKLVAACPTSVDGVTCD